MDCGLVLFVDDIFIMFTDNTLGCVIADSVLTSAPIQSMLLFNPTRLIRDTYSLAAHCKTLVNSFKI